MHGMLDYIPYTRQTPINIHANYPKCLRTLSKTISNADCHPTNTKNARRAHSVRSRGTCAKFEWVTHLMGWAKLSYSYYIHRDAHIAFALILLLREQISACVKLCAGAIRLIYSANVLCSNELFRN